MFVKITNGQVDQYPYTVGELRKANPNVSFPRNIPNDTLAQKAADVRAQRDRLLSATDWRFRSDMNPSQGWIDYCQALRDVPAQVGFPWDVTWPTQPE